MNRLGIIFRRLQAWLAHAWQTVAPGRVAWRGAALGLLLGAIVAGILFAYHAFFAFHPLAFLVALFALLMASTLAGLGLVLVVAILHRLPAGVKITLVAALILLITTFVPAQPRPATFTAAVVVFLLSLLGAALWSLSHGGWGRTTGLQKAILLAGLLLGGGGLVAGVAWLADAGTPLDPPVNAATQIRSPLPALNVADPSRPGPYPVRTLTYGSGDDPHRPEYGEEVTIPTTPVNGSPFLSGWSALRTTYWGFGPHALPRNGRVWFPEGDGPFPLVLIVHGNHLMADFSDAGYAYLGDLLASRGFIAVSVDENFLNSSPAADLAGFQQLEEENDARGWLLLEHLTLWRKWNRSPQNRFYQQVDLDNIALIGHSRGGEAVAVAAAFNRLRRYPDAATVTFDYGFNIRSVVAIAPIDGQYTPAGQGTPLRNVNYFVLHGAHDMDVTSFSGTDQYGRVTFSGDDFWFKAGLYVYGANHGQFNTTWGRADTIRPAANLFNLAQLMPAEDQRQVAKVTIAAFLEATLHGREGYLPLFRDVRLAADWLPDTLYLNQYADARTTWIATFDEDVDVTRATRPGTTLAGTHLTTWREGKVGSKWGVRETGAVTLGWQESPVADYTVSLAGAGLSPGRGSTLTFALAATASDDNPRDPIDLTLLLRDRAGQAARLPLSHFAPLQPHLEAQLYKAPFLSDAATGEIVFQHYEFPLAAFATANPDFDPAGLDTIRFVFDKTPAGEIVLDNLGLRD